ncbi:hypothetical protein PPERSA_02525 [Pseudocohnilembus persalinus]|uniref:SKP1 component dimerisation domain-containing protein n=1 Tax=Pseudocohnilembus persalinus TaxID=266149 RepID=A0A0V0R606_PSEPJ|nr:hypothetical protein PPERSA_02525 [Pseudocohnilembus persalinus]|eukprot:KRX09653.1 hypothetical protein PPERSA_02525 [Pseudocohnilembus persalinus]
MEAEQIILKSTIDGNQEVTFESSLKEFSPDLIGEADLSQAIPVDVDKKSLEVFKNFLEVHDYDPSKIVITKPLKSDKLEDHLDKQSYEIFKNYFGPENSDKIKPLVELAYYLNCEKFKAACLITLGCPFYIGNTEKDKQQFKQKWGIQDLTPEEERQIIDENKPVFEQINQMYEQRMEEEKEKYEKELGNQNEQ